MRQPVCYDRLSRGGFVVDIVDAGDDREVEAVGHTVSDVRRQVGKQLFCRQAFEPIRVQFWIQGQDFEDVFPVAVLCQRHEPWFHGIDQLHDFAPKLDRLGVPAFSRIEGVGDVFDNYLGIEKVGVMRVARQAVQDESPLLVDMPEHIFRKGCETALHIGREADAWYAVVFLIGSVSGYARLKCFDSRRVKVG